MPNTIESPNQAASHSALDQGMNADVVLYDGECRFCCSQINILKRLDGKKRLRFLSLHDPSVPENYPDLSRDQLMEQMWVVAPNGQKFGGADAVRYLSRRLPMLYPFAPILHLPFTMPLWRWMYRLVAKYRYRIAGKNCENGSCSIHAKKHA
jgi:predicted DCC family thiol-disulfide oxidoreductase YuxK